MRARVRAVAASGFFSFATSASTSGDVPSGARPFGFAARRCSCHASSNAFDSLKPTVSRNRRSSESLTGPVGATVRRNSSSFGHALPPPRWRR